jgi:hypothetical protein
MTGPEALHHQKDERRSLYRASSEDNLGYERAGQDRVRRRDQSHQTDNNLLPAVSHPGLTENSPRFHDRGRAASPLMRG